MRNTGWRHYSTVEAAQGRQVAALPWFIDVTRPYALGDADRNTDRNADCNADGNTDRTPAVRRTPYAVRPPCSALILCGGRSTRMGRDKASLPFGDESLLGRVARTVGSIADEVVLVAREGQVLPPGFDAVRDPAEGLGPVAAIAVGLRAVSSARALVVACDLPLLRPGVIARLFDLAEDADACVPLIDGYPMTTCAVYAARVADVADGLVTAGHFKMRTLLERIATRYVGPDQLRDVDPELESFQDCNTQEAYAAALRKAGFTAP